MIDDLYLISAKVYVNTCIMQECVDSLRDIAPCTVTCSLQVYLLQHGKKIHKKRTSTKKRERSPIFNEAMIFSVPAHTLQVSALCLAGRIAIVCLFGKCYYSPKRI